MSTLNNETGENEEGFASAAFQYFFENVGKISLVGYSFWSAILLLAGATVILVIFNIFVPRVDGNIACTTSSNFYAVVSLWYFESFLLICTSVSHAAVNSKLDYEFITSTTQFLGFFVRFVPTIVRLIHIFTFFQTTVLYAQFLILPECNKVELQTCLVIISVFWWILAVVGVIAKRKIFVPPQLFEPLRPDSGFFTEIDVS